MQTKQSFISACANAAAGICSFFTTERNARIHLAMAILTITAAIVLKLSGIQWVAVLCCIALVMGAEMMNSAVEKLCDLVHSDYHPVIKTIKDVAAGAVLLAALISVVVALIIFLPKLNELL